MSPFPQYRSKILTAFMRQLSVLRDRTETLARHAKVVGKWTLEVALYPLYRWTQFQATIGKQVGQAAKDAIASLKAAQEQPSNDTSTPIENVLASIELSSPTQARVINVTSHRSKSSLSLQTHRRSQRWLQRGIAAIKRVGSTLAITSSFSTELSAFSRNLPWPSSSRKIQGIASDLNSRSLVLVTPKQEILDVLTPPQQAMFKLKIIWAIQNFSVRSRLRQVQQKLSAQRQRLGQTIVVARLPEFATNVEHNTAITLSSTAHPRRWVKQGITAIKTLGTAFRLSGSRAETPGSVNQPLRRQTQSEAIQGIASRLDTRTLVLVNAHQDILDILTPQQQTILKLKINWEIHRFSVRSRLGQVQRRLAAGLLQLSQNAAQLKGVQPAAFTILRRPTLSLPQVPKALQELKRWGLRSLVGAIAALPIVAIPAIAAEATPGPKAPSEIEAQWVDPNHLKTQIAWDELQGMALKSTPGVSWLANAPSARQPQSSLDQSFYTPDDAIEIPVEAEFLGYEPHLLEQILGWLDTLLITLEAAIASVWKWVGLVVIASLTILHKVRLTLFG